MDELFGLIITCVLCFIMGMAIHTGLISKYGYPIKKDCKISIKENVYRVTSLDTINDNKIVLEIYKLEK